MSRNPCLDAVLGELAEVGIWSPQVIGNGHLQFVWQNAHGQRRMVSISSSPSALSAPAAARADVRRILKQDGMIDVDGARAAPRQLSRLERLGQRIHRLEAQLVRLERSGMALPIQNAG